MTNALTGLVAELKANKRKAAILAAVTLVALILFARMLGGKGDAPQAASGGDTTAAPPSVKTTSAMLDQAADRDKSRVRDRDEYIRKLDRTIGWDIEPNPTLYPPPSKPAAGPMKAGDPPTAVTTQPSTADIQAIHEQQIRDKAAALEVQSTIEDGNSTTAIINGRVLRAGDWISGFQIIRITSESCVVARDGVEVTLTLNK